MPEEAAQKTKTISWQKIILTVLIILLVAGAIAAALFWYFCVRQPEEPTTNTTTKQPTTSSKKATSSAKPNETAGWKLYESKTFGYSFKYPTTYKIEGPGQQTPNQIEVNSPDYSYSESPDGRFITNGSNLNITVAATNKGGAWRMTEYQENLRTIEVAGQAAKRFDYETSSNGYFDLVSLDGNNRYYEFWFHAAGKNKAEETKNFELLLSTFKFLD